jgi:hypothetical protein
MSRNPQVNYLAQTVRPTGISDFVGLKDVERP